MTAPRVRREPWLSSRPARLAGRPTPAITAGLLALLVAACPLRPATAARGGDLTELSLEELMNTEITSVSRKPEVRSAAADAIYVITEDEIRRSGARTLADALRLALSGFVVMDLHPVDRRVRHWCPPECAGVYHDGDAVETRISLDIDHACAIGGC